VERYFASCPRGLEPLLADELAMLQADAIEPGSGGVAFAGPPELAYRVNLHSRLATRVLQRVSAGRYFSEEEIYRGALAVFWERWFAVDRTLAVKVSAQACPLKSLEFVTLRIKDAICDRFREVTGRRPDVDTRSPDVRIHAHLDATHYTLFLDTSGEPLFKRGLRQQAGLAPINENLAAGILALAGWHPGIPLLDPMCGSGTFLLEAAQIALGIAPGLNRRFAFETFRHFDATAWRTLCDAARAVQRPASALPIYGSDLTAEALRDAHANLKAAGLAGAVTLSRADLRDLTPPAATGILVMNPPYGVRLGHEADLADFYPQLGDALKQRFSGWNAYIISADRALPKHIRLAASRRTPLYNGDLDCRLYEYRMVEGGNRG
jgi:putative N6-adenine-specific DNA methylase